MPILNPPGGCTAPGTSGSATNQGQCQTSGNGKQFYCSNGPSTPPPGPNGVGAAISASASGGVSFAGANIVGGADRGPQGSHSASGSANGTRDNSMSPSDLNAYYAVAGGIASIANMVGGNCENCPQSLAGAVGAAVGAVMGSVK